MSQQEHPHKCQHLHQIVTQQHLGRISPASWCQVPGEPVHCQQHPQDQPQCLEVLHCKCLGNLVVLGEVEDGVDAYAVELGYSGCPGSGPDLTSLFPTLQILAMEHHRGTCRFRCHAHMLLYWFYRLCSLLRSPARWIYDYALMLCSLSRQFPYSAGSTLACTSKMLHCLYFRLTFYCSTEASCCTSVSLTPILTFSYFSCCSYELASRLCCNSVLRHSNSCPIKLASIYFRSAVSSLSYC